jgi:hypothetical protein
MYTYKSLKLPKEPKELKVQQRYDRKKIFSTSVVVSILGMDLATTRSLSKAENQQSKLLIPPTSSLERKCFITFNWMFCHIIHKLHGIHFLQQLLVTSHRLTYLQTFKVQEKCLLHMMASMRWRIFCTTPLNRNQQTGKWWALSGLLLGKTVWV